MEKKNYNDCKFGRSEKKTRESEKVYLTVMRNQEAVERGVGRSKMNIFIFIYC